MAQATVRNISPGKLSIPAPFNVSIHPGQQSTVHSVDPAVLALSTDLNLLRNKGYITVDVSRDSNVDDQLESADISTILNTESNITFNVDYNSATAVDPPAGTIFKSQIEVDNFLGRMGAAKFKHLQPIYNTLPSKILHIITVNLAAGVHRPHPTIQGSFTAWDLSTKQVGFNGELKLIGAAPSLYNAKSGLATAISITSIQAGSNDPFINVSGTPFTGHTLRGWYAVLNTGQTVLIHDNTNSQIRVMEFISPTPTSILFIGRPSTILRNSFADIVKANSFGALNTGTAEAGEIFPGNTITLQDVTVDGFGANSNMFIHGSGSLTLVRHILDQDTAIDFGVTPDGNGWFLGGFPFLQSCAFINRQVSGGADRLATIDSDGTFLFGCYFEGTENAIPVRRGSLFILGVVFRSVGSTDPATLGSLMLQGPTVFLDMAITGGAKVTEFRDGKAGIPALHISGGAATRPDFQHAIFKNNLAPCVRIGQNGTLDLSLAGSLGYKDGGTNGDVGIDIVGPGALASLNTGTDITGTAGNVRLGGVVQTYASIPSTGTGHLNSVSAARRA